MPTLFSSPKTPSPPPIPAPVPQPVPQSPNNDAVRAQQAQTIAQIQSQSGRDSTNLVKGQSATLGGG